MSKIAISLKSPILFQSTKPTAQIEIQVLAGVPRNCTELLYSFLRLLAFVGKYSSHLSEILTGEGEASCFSQTELRPSCSPRRASATHWLGYKMESAIKKQQYGSKGIEHELILQPIAKKGLQCFGHYIQRALQKEVSLE